MSSRLADGIVSSRLADGIARAAVTVALVTVAARLVGLARTVVLAATVGDSGFVGNTYAAANTLPNIVFEVVAGGALASLVVPVLAADVGRGDLERAGRTASGLLTWTVVVLTPVAVLGALFARPLMSLLTGGVDDASLRDAQVDLGARMLVVFMPQVLLYGVGIVLAGVLQAHRRFLGPALAPLLSSLVVMGAYVAYAGMDGSGLPGQVSRGEELVLSIGTTCGVAALSLSLLVPTGRLRLHLRPVLRLPDGVGAQVRRLALAGAAGVVAQQVALLVGLVITNSRSGAVIAYQLSYTVFLLPWGVLAVPLATGAFPTLAATAHDDTDGYRTTLSGSLRSMVVVCGGATALLWALHRPIALLLPYHPSGGGDVVEQGVVGRDAVATGIAVLAIGLIPYGVLALLTRALFARGRNLAAAGATVAGFAVAAGTSVVLAAADPSQPVRSVAVGHSVGMVVAAVLLVVAVHRDSGPGSLQGCGRAVAVTLPVVAVGAVAGRLLADRIGSPGARPALAGLSLAVVVATAAVYVGGLAAVRSAELKALRRFLRRRTRSG